MESPHFVYVRRSLQNPATLLKFNLSSVDKPHSHQFGHIPTLYRVKLSKDAFLISELVLNNEEGEKKKRACEQNTKHFLPRSTLAVVKRKDAPRGGWEMFPLKKLARLMEMEEVSQSESG